MPGYRGQITLECWTSSSRIISCGAPAGIVTLDRVVTNDKIKFKGTYQNQIAPRLSKCFKV